MRQKNTMKGAYLETKSHDKDSGKVNKVCISYDQTNVVSISEDGTLCTYKLDFASFKSSARDEIPSSYIYPDLANGLSETSFVETVDLKDHDEEDVVDDSIYSI